MRTAILAFATAAIVAAAQPAGAIADLDGQRDRQVPDQLRPLRVRLGLALHIRVSWRVRSRPAGPWFASRAVHPAPRLCST
jgi:hypothetical protein